MTLAFRVALLTGFRACQGVVPSFSAQQKTFLRFIPLSPVILQDVLVCKIGFNVVSPWQASINGSVWFSEEMLIVAVLTEYTKGGTLLRTKRVDVSSSLEGAVLARITFMPAESLEATGYHPVKLGRALLKCARKVLLE